jgi:mannosyltransferase
MSRSNTRLWLAGILLLAFGLRLINLGGRTLWYDEAFAVLFAEKGWDVMVDGTLTEVDGSAADVHPLLYYQSLKYWMDFVGQKPAAVRLYSVLLGVLTVAAVFGLTHDWFGDDRTALVAAFITAVAPFHVQYSQEARMYALMGLLLVLTTWAYWRAWQRNHWVYWLLFGVLAGISMYTQQLAGFYLMALGLIVFLKREYWLIGRTILAALLALAIYLPWLLNLPGQLGKLRQYWVQRPNVLHFWLTLRSFTSVNLDFAAAWWLPTFLLAAVLIVFLLFRGYHALRQRNDNPDREALGWALWLAFMPMILMWVFSTLFQPVFLPRALLPSAVIFYITMAWLFTRGGMPSLIVGVLAGGWGVVIVFGLVTHYTWDVFPNAPFDDAVDYLAENVTPGDSIVHGNKITALPMVYYDRDLPQRYVRDIPGSGSDTLAVPTQETLGLLADACAASAIQGAPRVWYVAFEQLEDEMQDIVEDDPSDARYDSLTWLRTYYEEQHVESFNDLDVYLFVNPADSVPLQCEGE